MSESKSSEFYHKEVSDTTVPEDKVFGKDHWKQLMESLHEGSNRFYEDSEDSQFPLSIVIAFDINFDKLQKAGTEYISLRMDDKDYDSDNDPILSSYEKAIAAFKKQLSDEETQLGQIAVFNVPPQMGENKQVMASFINVLSTFSVVKAVGIASESFGLNFDMESINELPEPVKEMLDKYQSGGGVPGGLQNPMFDDYREDVFTAIVDFPSGQWMLKDKVVKGKLENKPEYIFISNEERASSTGTFTSLYLGDDSKDVGLADIELDAKSANAVQQYIIDMVPSPFDVVLIIELLTVLTNENKKKSPN